MTGDVEEECSLLQISQELVDSVPSNIVSQAESAPYINSNMTVDEACMYTATVPTGIANNYPEGTVLQIIPHGTVVTLPVKCLSSNESNTVIFKDSSFVPESAASQNVLSNLLANAPESCETQVANVEGNISDIDLSFLHETEVTNAISDPKCLNENTVKEFQGMIAGVSQESLNLLQNNLSIGESAEKPTQGFEQQTQNCVNDSENRPGDVVMIDVSKPIQLQQNTLIMVNGQKCILQQDPQTGQVIAYPIKEQEKPKRRRGRPRKASIEQPVTAETGQTETTEAVDAPEVESQSEDEAEKGLLEVVNDDGALVRRSSRKRKQNKVLKDYETGNLQQELGSDVEDPMILVEKEDDITVRKRKNKGPGRPRKYPKPLNLESVSSDGNKRPRGRPRKHVNENEPSQAFLVQTADGQVLMMQVPLSSIPPDMTLQEMAEQIATKLNESLNQTNSASTDKAKDSTTQEPQAPALEQVTESNLCKENEAVSENVVQDHSIGSTTNFLNVNQQLTPADENFVEVVENVCQMNIMKNVSSIMVDSVGQVEEVVLENNDCSKNSDCSNLQSLITESILENQNNLNSLNIPENNFCINVPQNSTSLNDSNSVLCSIDENATNQFCVTKSPEETYIEDFQQVEEIQSTTESKIPDLYIKNEILKDKVDFQLLLQTSSDSTSDVQSMQIEELLKNVNSENIEKELSFKESSEKGTMTYTSELIDNFNACTDRQFELNRIANFHSYYQTKDNFNCEAVNTDVENNMDNNVFQPENMVENEEMIHSDISESTEIRSVENNKSSQFIKTDSDNQSLDILLRVKEILPTEKTLAVDGTHSVTPATTVIPVPDKVFPIILPAPPPPGSKCCKVCKAPYFTDEELIKHFKLKHPKCICSECDYMAEHPYVVKRHFYRHTNQPCICNVCHKSYKDLYILKMHIKMVHLPPDVVYTCDLCEKCFTRKAHLKRHLRIHEPVKQYQCSHCAYQGCEKSDLTKHMLIHGDPKFSCDVCGKAFRHLKNRDLHVKRHSGQRDYKCGVCDFYGYTFTDIRKHIERRHKNAACKDCETIFSNPETLKEHKLSGNCRPVDGIKIEEIQPSEDSKEVPLLDEMPIELLEPDQGMTVKECSEETLSALQSGHFVMTSVEGMLDGQTGQFVLEGLEECNITPDGLSVISDKDINKAITLVTSDGRNLSLSLKNSSLPLECVTSTNEIDQDN